MAEVTYICKRTVVSTTPVQPGKTHTLSCLERLTDPDNHVMIVLYYRTGRATSPAGELTKKLKESLAETLTCFPVITGRLVKEGGGEDGSNKWIVKCNDAGVRLVEARAKGSVEGWLESVDSDKEKRFLVHWEDLFHKPYFWATLYIQVTEFEEGGVAIGLSCTHLLTDLVSASNFIKAWADITIRGKIMHPPIFHRFSTPHRQPKPKPDPKSDLINHYNGTNPNCTDDTNYKTISLAFSDQMVRSCVSKTQAHGPDPSPFEALSGLIWASVSRLRRPDKGLVGLTMGLDTRKLLGLDQGYFGSCMVYANVTDDDDDEVNTNTNLLAARATQAIGEVKSRIDREGIIDLMEWIDQNLYQFHGFRYLVCLNLEHINDHYPVSFGEGLDGPICARYYIDSIYKNGSFIILPSSTGDGPFGRIVMLTLHEDEVFRLCKDDLILSFSPTILMGAK